MAREFDRRVELRDGRIVADSAHPAPVGTEAGR
jgi:hypothetical protein